MKTELSNGHNVTINKKLLLTYERYYGKLTKSHIDFILVTNNINPDAETEKAMSKCINNVLKEEIQTAVDLTSPNILQKAISTLYCHNPW